MYLYCLRHGESTFNAQQRIQGQADPPLSDLGRQQAAAAAEALAKAGITALYASPLRRALETAQIIAGRLGIPVQTDQRLMEIHVGVLQGKTWEEVEAELPEVARSWRSYDPDYVLPGGESRRQLMRRAYAVFCDIRRAGCSHGPPEHVAVVSHGGTLAAAFKALLRIPAECNPFSLMNAAITKLQWPPERGDRIKLLVLNDVEHLRNGSFNGRQGDL